MPHNEEICTLISQIAILGCERAGHIVKVYAEKGEGWECSSSEMQTLIEPKFNAALNNVNSDYTRLTKLEVLKKVKPRVGIIRLFKLDFELYNRINALVDAIYPQTKISKKDGNTTF